MKTLFFAKIMTAAFLFQIPTETLPNDKPKGMLCNVADGGYRMPHVAD